jgi:hypothetical protein
MFQGGNYETFDYLVGLAGIRGCLDDPLGPQTIQGEQGLFKFH